MCKERAPMVSRIKGTARRRRRKRKKRRVKKWRNVMRNGMKGKMGRRKENEQRKKN
jgi:hypothetical protein